MRAELTTVKLDNSMKLNTRLCTITLLAGALTACNGDNTVVGTPADSTAPTTTAATITETADAGSATLLNFSMPDVNGGTRRENAVVLLPVGDAPEGGWPIIGWGHGTTGVADVCAPSASDNLSGYATYLNSWLASGYAIVAPDYEGLGTEGGHPYLHLDSEGRSINYAVAAAVEAMPSLSTQYAVLGHSQGGHAVLGAASLADENPSVTMVGAVAMAPVSQVISQGAVLTAIIDNANASIEQRVAAAVGNLGFSALLLHGIETLFPAFDLDAAYATNGTTLQTLTETACLPQINAELQTSVPSVLIDDGNVDSFIVADIEQSADLLSYFESVEPGTRAMGTPLLLAQGTTDTTVFANSTNALLSQLSAVSDTDTDPSLITYDGVDHVGILAASFNDAAAFITMQFANQ